ncbi:MAG: hypothetical protein CM15mV52_0600 [uncultured marine virus]|nr:MAG: hypothetical protein CM15mV52_0600 [uncultured marine virus]
MALKKSQKSLKNGVNKNGAMSQKVMKRNQSPNVVDTYQRVLGLD